MTYNIKNTSSSVYLTKRDQETLNSSLVGLKDLGLMCGFNNMSYFQAHRYCNEIKKAIKSCSKLNAKRLKPIHNQICLSFGPEFDIELI